MARKLKAKMDKTLLRPIALYGSVLRTLRKKEEIKG